LAALKKLLSVVEYLTETTEGAKREKNNNLLYNGRENKAFFRTGYQ
jgi:hypothetical protein